MEERKILLRQIARRLRDISDEIDKKQLKLSLLTSIKRRVGTIFYLIISSFMPGYNFIFF